MFKTALLAASFAVPFTATHAAERVLDAERHHVRNGDRREWAEFPAEAEAERLVVTFHAEPNATPFTLLLRQEDVKQTWEATLNDRRLGRLSRDENDMQLAFDVPPKTLVAGENRLVVETRSDKPDDVRLGPVRLFDAAFDDVFPQASLKVTVRDLDRDDRTPSRITIVDEHGTLAALRVEPSPQRAVRSGVVFTADGTATIGLLPGKYTVYAGRGFEYGVDSEEVTVEDGKTVEVGLGIRREVPTEGWIACDTHVHTLEVSGHGDASLDERMVTLAAEGIELPISTEHNKQFDYGPAAERVGVRRYFTPVVGNEVTTKVGHFNVFPAPAGGPVPDHTPTEWPAIFENIFATPGVRACILNHARDVHSGVTPFGPARHNALVGESLLDWEPRFNGLEVVNSGAQQSDVMQLTRDWFGLVNAGHRVTPVGSSDSHDVARHFVGQGRTYLRADNSDPGKIDVEEAVDSFLAGRVLVSCGLLVKISVNGEHGPGDLVPQAERYEVDLRVFGPSWTRTDSVQLYRNGHAIGGATDEEPQPPAGADGELTKVVVPSPKHDVWLCAVATGPGVREPFWPIAKPYQPDSPEWNPRSFALTGAVFLDCDGDGKWSSPRDYAERIVSEAKSDPKRVLKELAGYDEAVAVHAARLLHEAGFAPLTPDWRKTIADAPAAARRGFEAYANAWRETVVARSRTGG